MGRHVLDVATGSGVGAQAALHCGAASVVGVDLSIELLRHCPAPIRRVGADITRLPFRDASFDVALAGCCLGHLTDPLEGLSELHRVAPALVASAFEAGWTHPAKTAVERVLHRHGWAAPPWYATFKTVTEPRVGDPDTLRTLAETAGYRAHVRRLEVDTGLDHPAAMVAWRLGMAHVAPFVLALSREQQQAIRAEAEAGLRGAPAVVVPLLVLTGR